jgi:DNA-binding CsgD family transcriptional regulator
MAKDRSDLRNALEGLRSSGHVTAAVRPEITASWQRSIACDLQPDRVRVPYAPEVHTDDRLERAARPVLDRLVEDLDSATMSLLLCDRDGYAVERFPRDRALQARLDRIMVAPGFCYHESRVGTNAVGMALEQRAPSMVTGAEHYADAFARMACAAAPIIDPATSAVLGAVDLTCSVDYAQSLMLVVARQFARAIEQRLVSEKPDADRVLLNCFVDARRRARGALVALNGRAMYTNAPAVKLVRDIDRTLLWDLVSSALFDQPRAALDLPVPAGSLTFVSCESITDGGEVIGALVRFLRLPGAIDRLVTAPEQSRRLGPAVGWESLTETERSVADLVSEGRTNREVAAAMYLSSHTVDCHLRHIFDKLGVHSRVELTRLVVERGREGGIVTPFQQAGVATSLGRSRHLLGLGA